MECVCRFSTGLLVVGVIRGILSGIIRMIFMFVWIVIQVLLKSIIFENTDSAALSLSLSFLSLWNPPPLAL